MYILFILILAWVEGVAREGRGKGKKKRGGTAFRISDGTLRDTLHFCLKSSSTNLYKYRKLLRE